MRRALWIIGVLLGIGLIAAVVGRRVCACCEPEGEEETQDSEQEVEVKAASEEGEVSQKTEAVSEGENSDPRRSGRP